jgi:hypothetical protein
VPARLHTATSGQPAGLRHAQDPLADADIPADFEGVAAGLQVEDSRHRP